MKQRSMKYIGSISILLTLLFGSCQQEISPEQSEHFIKFFGNTYMDEATDLEVLEDGSYAICGVDSIGVEGKRMVLVVTDEYGNVKSGFPKYFSENNLQSGANTIVVKRGGQGGFLLVGYVEKPTGAGSDVQRDLFLVKTSLMGEVSWQKSFGSPEDETALHATEMISSGGFILAGYQVRDGKSDIMIMGVTEEGDSIKLGLNYNNPQADNSSANYILNTGEQYLCVCTYNKVSSAGTDILVLNFDDELSPNYEPFTDALVEVGQCIVQDDENRYLVLGNQITLSGNSQIKVYLIETSGLLITRSLEVATISEVNTDLLAKRFVKMDDGRFAIVGTRRSKGNNDIFLQFLTSDYQTAERLIYGATGDQRGADIDLPEAGGLIMLGTNGYGENSMISLIRTGDDGDL
jgi:hypothetical protein